MPTLEERIDALERTTVALQSERITDGMQLHERLQALQRLIINQRRLRMEREQDLEQMINKNFDETRQALAQQGQQLALLGQRLAQHSKALEALTSRVDMQGDQLEQQGQAIKELHSKFDTLSTKVDLQGDQLDALNGKLHQQGLLLRQILNRLPPAA